MSPGRLYRNLMLPLGTLELSWLSVPTRGDL